MATPKQISDVILHLANKLLEYLNVCVSVCGECVRATSVCVCVCVRRVCVYGERVCACVAGFTLSHQYPSSFHKHEV